MKLEAKRQDAALRVWIGSWEAGCGAGSLDFSLTAVRCKGSSRGKKGILVSTGGSGSLPARCRGAAGTEGPTLFFDNTYALVFQSR